uniref:FAF domain-containing protein n=1 Tax=Salix viminalis TaxID=40686 RepID=A0A6N2MH41_SALVM
MLVVFFTFLLDGLLYPPSNLYMQRHHLHLLRRHLLRLTSSSDVTSTGACFNQRGEIMNVDAEKYVAFGNSTKKKGLFPPPISCLKLFSKGMPYRYLIYNEEDDSFELEEIKILRGDILRANRSGGRSRLAFVVSDDESSDIEEEEETNGTAE